MFTGLIEDVGEVESWEMRRRAGLLRLKTRLPLRAVNVGASITVNGACLTVIGKGRNSFTVDVSPETLKCTNLEKIRPGDLVNLERSLRLSDRLGGHLVSGHVDGVGVIDSINKRGEFTFFWIRVPTKLGSLLVPKGSVAVDGISLTVNQCGDRGFSVAIIPFTLKHTNLRARRVGDKVNVETDLIGKYVQKLLHARRVARIRT